MEQPFEEYIKEVNETIINFATNNYFKNIEDIHYKYPYNSDKNKEFKWRTQWMYHINYKCFNIYPSYSERDEYYDELDHFIYSEEINLLTKTDRINKLMLAHINNMDRQFNNVEEQIFNNFINNTSMCLSTNKRLLVKYAYLYTNSNLTHEILWERIGLETDMIQLK